MASAGFGPETWLPTVQARGVFNVTAFGARGDGRHDDTDAINLTIDHAYAAGGGSVYLPAGRYKTTGNIRLRDNVHLQGSGYQSHIENTALHGFAKCGIVSGNLGDPTNNKSLFDEVKYPLGAIRPGDTRVTLLSTLDATRFASGNVVGIASHEVWTGERGNHERQLNLNQVVGVEGNDVMLRYPIPDRYASTPGQRPSIRKLTGNVSGYDGTPLWMSTNCGASNLRITQTTGGTSGWYALFPCGINQRFEDIHMDNVSTMIGSNGLGQSVFRRINGSFEAGFLDFAEWQTGNLAEDIHGTRFGVNRALNCLGLSNNNGADNIFRRVTGRLGGWGRFSLTKVARGRFEDCTVIGAGSLADPNSTEAILLGYAPECVATGNTIIDTYRHGIHAVGERHDVSYNRIHAVGDEGYSVYARASVNRIKVYNNIFGESGQIGQRDRFYQQFGPSPQAEVYGNTGYRGTSQ